LKRIKKQISMKLKGIDENQLIKILTLPVKKDTSVLRGIGDDAAIIRDKKNKFLLITTDILIENIHFKIAEAESYQIGHKALACNISDIAACGGRPKYALISLGLPKNLSLNFIKGIYRGIKKLANRYKITIVGGDISSSEKLTINITLLGFAKRENLVFRDGAKVGDRIFVTGKLGGSGKGKHLKFSPRVNEALILTKKYKINSMIDLSDGLAQDLYNIISRSKTGAYIHEDCIPLSSEAENIDSALYEGEDFELLFTAPERESEKIKGSRAGKLKITEIGRIVEKSKGFKIIGKDKKAKEVSLKYAFKHF
jgi:thiamine-monophosphate kinase